MFLSLNWLKDLVEIPKSITPEGLAQALTRHTVEVENVVSQAKQYDNILVGKILDIKKHPNADKLSLVKIDIGSKKLEIVCGATNIKTGQLVPVALAGALLPNGVEIQAADIKGVKSNGMLCAADELKLGDDHNGIMILKKGKLGQSLAELLNLDDVIFEVDGKSISHRSDLWCHYGMAREIAAFLNSRLKADLLTTDKIKVDDDKYKLKVKVENFNLCPRYLAIRLDNITITGSPPWLKEKLIATGMRPINNIVDITNYVMLELGQPLHAFDAKLVDEIIVRQAKKGEPIKTLDNVVRRLTESDLVIADADKPIAIAGIIGGQTSEISPKTTSIIIEAANFNYISIRKTSQKSALRTEASLRFEKGLDPNLAQSGICRAVKLIKQVAPGAKVVSRLIDEKKYKLDLGPIELDLTWLENFIGMKIAAEKIKKILGKLGFGCESIGNKLKVAIPSWRAVRDVSLKEDLAEEIIRIYGYDKLISVMPKIKMHSPLGNEELILERKIKNILCQGANLTETYNYSFVGDKQLLQLNLDPELAIRIANPIASHLNLLRPALAPNLIENVKSNQAKFNQIGLFEIGNIFLDSPGKINKDGNLTEKVPYQEKHLAIAIANEAETDIFNKLKGAITYLFNNFNLTVKYAKAEALPGWADKLASAQVTVAGETVGFVASLNRKVSLLSGLKKSSVIAEFSLKKILRAIQMNPNKKFKEFAKYPALTRDLAFVVDEEILYNEIRREIENYNPLIKQVELFDVYRGKSLGENKKNLAFHVAYRADKTLTSAEVDKLQQGLIKKLEKIFGAKIRNF